MTPVVVVIPSADIIAIIPSPLVKLPPAKPVAYWVSPSKGPINP